MFLTPDTTALLVADRRRAFESIARRRRLHRTSTPTTVAPATTPARLPVATDRTTVAPTSKAA